MAKKLPHGDKISDIQLGKRHDANFVREEKLEIKATKLGFSFSEIRLLRRLYGKHLKPPKDRRVL